MNPYSPPVNAPAKGDDELPATQVTLGGYLRQLFTCVVSILGATLIAVAIAYPVCYGLTLIYLDRMAVGIMGVVFYSVLLYRLISRDSTGTRRGVQLLSLLCNPPFTPTHYFLIGSSIFSFLAMIAASAYILRDHYTRRKSPDMMSELDIPVLIIFWVLYLFLSIAPALYFARRGTTSSQWRISVILLWIPSVIIGLSFGSLLL